ncbi:DNA repair RAD52-like protein 2, chloroplastic [Capsicum chacoense]
MLTHCTKSSFPPANTYLPTPRRCMAAQFHFSVNTFSPITTTRSSSFKLQVKANTGDGGVGKNAASSSNTNYVVPLDKTASSCITRPLAEILRDLNKRIPDNIIKPENGHDHSTFITWYHANRMLSFYAPGWCGEVRDVIFSDNGSVTVVYRVTIRGSDGEAHRESTGTVSPGNGHNTDLVAAAEEIAFCRACARFGLGLYLYH